ncbi:MAG: exodeoxyribonuclease VII small subunit [Chloroflexi bacterium]|nr:exodeoxyribonuclease VII small subunit [Chloroflexota bacterium]
MAQHNRNGAHGDKNETFEQSFVSLQEVVQKLSEGNLTLQEALSAFEDGMALADSCTAMLDEAELRVKQVSERALRSAAAAAGDFEAGTAEPGEDEALSFEVESFESNILFGTATIEKENGRRTSIQSNDASPMNRTQRGTSRASTYTFGKGQFPDELEPLFDEDD